MLKKISHLIDRRLKYVIKYYISQNKIYQGIHVYTLAMT